MIILYEDTEILVQLSMFNVSVKVVCQVWHLNLKMPNLKNEHRVVQPDKSNESNLYSIIKIRWPDSRRYDVSRCYETILLVS